MFHVKHINKGGNYNDWDNRYSNIYISVISISILYICIFWGYGLMREIEKRF